MRPPLDVRASLKLLAVGVPLITVLLVFGPRRTGDFVLLAGVAGGAVAFLYGPLYGQATGVSRRVVLALQALVVFGPMFVAGAFEGAMAPTLVTLAAILVAVGAALEALRRRAGRAATTARAQPRRPQPPAGPI